jgi:hypothetical protein
MKLEMKIFDIENSLNPELVYGALLFFNNKIHQVFDMDEENIYIRNEKSENFQINDSEWEPIQLDKKWLSKFNLEIDSKIKNSKTGVDFFIKYDGENFYYFSGNNSYIGRLNYVHDLQRLYFDLTNNKFLPSEY